MDEQRQDDYVWHFRLPASPAPGEDALIQMVREQVAALLKCVAFTSRGTDVRVTGFRFLDAPDVDHPLPPTLPQQDAKDS